MFNSGTGFTYGTYNTGTGLSTVNTDTLQVNGVATIPEISTEERALNTAADSVIISELNVQRKIITGTLPSADTTLSITPSLSGLTVGNTLLSVLLLVNESGTTNFQTVNYGVNNLICQVKFVNSTANIELNYSTGLQGRLFKLIVEYY